MIRRTDPVIRPAIAGKETGNAVKNENIVRKELGLQERVEDIKHVE